VKTKAKRRLLVILILFLLHALVSAVWAMVKLKADGPDFVGSPPRRYADQRNDVDLSMHGGGLEKFGKQFRTDGWFDFWSPAGLFAPVVHAFAGWTVHKDHVCTTGDIVSLFISPDDGDFSFHLLLPPASRFLAWRDGHVEEDRPNRTVILVEIDDPIRKNFPILPDLALHDRVRVCGRWVFDRGHGHNEIHPARCLEFLPEGAAPSFCD
jgi:hypothetical protein